MGTREDHIHGNPVQRMGKPVQNVGAMTILLKYVWGNHYTDLGGGPHIKINQGDQTKDLIEHKVRTVLVDTVGPLPDTEKIYTIWA